MDVSQCNEDQVIEDLTYINMHVRHHPQVYKEIGLQNWNTVLGLTETETTLIGTIQESLEVQNHMTIIAAMD